MSRTAFYPLTVTAVRRLTRDAVAVTLRPRPEDAARFEFAPGQYLTFRKTVDGDELRRSYSICAPPGEPLRVGVKRVPGGTFSTWINDLAKPGDVLGALPPDGHFYRPPDGDDAAAPRRYIGWACGSGITPLLSIIGATLRGEPRARFTLVYGNRAASSVMFRDELGALKSRYLGRFNLVHVLSRERNEIALFNGRLDRGKCAELLERWLAPAVYDLAYLCGPEEVMNAAAAALRDNGMAAGAIRRERFAATAAPPRRSAPAATTVDTARCHVELTLDGQTVGFDADPSLTLLESGLRHGLELPYACRAGVCASCRARLLEGEVDRNVSDALEDYEIARGAILTCQSYPLGKRVVVDYDER